MSDFLERLIDRSLGLTKSSQAPPLKGGVPMTPVIEPLIPSRYAPKTTDGLLVEDEEAIVAPPTETRDAISPIAMTHPPTPSSVMATEKTRDINPESEKNPIKQANSPVSSLITEPETDLTDLPLSNLPQQTDIVSETFTPNSSVAPRETLPDAKTARSLGQQQDISVEPHSPLSSAPQAAQNPQFLVPTQDLETPSLTNNVPKPLLADSSTHPLAIFDSRERNSQTLNSRSDVPTVHVKNWSD